MRIPFRQRFLGLALVLILVPLASSCAFKPDDGVAPPTPLPLNTTPQNLMERFEGEYEQQNLLEYELLFTSDFRFIFSSQSDPELAEEYGPNWGKDDEIESTGHLFDGFTSSEPPFETFGPATSIEMTFIPPQYFDDETRPDSGAFYKRVVVPKVNMDIKVLNGTEETTFQIDAQHVFFLVRGDVALLDPNQTATAERWYIYRWDDLSAPSAPVRAPRLSSVYSETPVGVSWGYVKSSYKPAP